MDCEVLIYEIILQRRATNLLGHKNIPKYSEIGKKTEMFLKLLLLHEGILNLQQLDPVN